MTDDKIKLKKGICPKCGNPTVFTQHSSDHGLCGGMDYWTTEGCPKCRIYNVEYERERERKRRKEEKHQKKVEFYEKYIKPFL